MLSKKQIGFTRTKMKFNETFDDDALSICARCLLPLIGCHKSPISVCMNIYCNQSWRMHTKVPHKFQIPFATNHQDDAFSKPNSQPAVLISLIQLFSTLPFPRRNFPQQRASPRARDWEESNRCGEKQVWMGGMWGVMGVWYLLASCMFDFVLYFFIHADIAEHWKLHISRSLQNLEHCGLRMPPAATMNLVLYFIMKWCQTFLTWTSWFV